MIDAANNYPWVDATGGRLPDIQVGHGQTWLTLTSVVEGVTDVIAYVPGIKDGAKHRIFAKKSGPTSRSATPTAPRTCCRTRRTRSP